MYRVGFQRIVRALEGMFPGNDFADACLFDVGFRSTAIVAHGYVYLVGRHRAAAESYEKERHLLPSLQSLLPCRIPCPDWSLPESESEVSPYGAMRYPLVPGVPLTRDILSRANELKIARDIGSILRIFHRLSPRMFDAYVDPGFSAQLHTARGLCLPILEERVTAAEFALLQKWFEDAAETACHMAFLPTPIHGDLWYENLLVNENCDSVVGILDFECCALADSAKDFAPLLYLGEAFLDAAMEAYESPPGDDDSFRARIQRHWEIREFGGIEYALATGDSQEMEDSICKIRKGPILNSDAD